MTPEDLIIKSREIYQRAVADFKPMATVLMFSGGDDSLTTYHVAKELGINLDFVIHGNTRTGIEETTHFVRDKVERMGDNYAEADAGISYVNYVMRKGFFGSGRDAHNFSYHILKQDHFEKAISKYVRMRQRNFPILFLNGGRRDESENRKIKFISPYTVTKRRPNDVWVNLINDWSKEDCKNYLAGNSIIRNPVSVNLCRSGECMCGTMQSKGDRQEASFFYPDWANQLNELERRVKALHGFGWGEAMPVRRNKQQLDLFQPMCIGCTKNAI